MRGRRELMSCLAGTWMTSHSASQIKAMEGGGRVPESAPRRCPAGAACWGLGGRVVTRKMGIRWHLRLRMAEKGLFQTSDLVPLLAERGIHLS